MSIDLTPELRKIALDALRAYLNAPPLENGLTPVDIEADLDTNRLQTNGLQRLFSSSGIITAGGVLENLTGA
jgi:hypothetical protein